MQGTIESISKPNCPPARQICLQNTIANLKRLIAPEPRIHAVAAKYYLKEPF